MAALKAAHIADGSAQTLRLRCIAERSELVRKVRILDFLIHSLKSQNQSQQGNKNKAWITDKRWGSVSRTAKLSHRDFAGLIG